MAVRGKCAGPECSAGGIQIIPSAVQKIPACGHHAAVGEVIPVWSDLLPSCSHGAVLAAVIPGAVQLEPAGEKISLVIKIIPFIIDNLPGTEWPAAVIVAVPPSGIILDPLAESGASRAVLRIGGVIIAGAGVVGRISGTAVIGISPVVAGLIAVDVKLRGVVRPELTGIEVGIHRPDPEAVVSASGQIAGEIIFSVITPLGSYDGGAGAAAVPAVQADFVIVCGIHHVPGSGVIIPGQIIIFAGRGSLSSDTVQVDIKLHIRAVIHNICIRVRGSKAA